MSVTANKKAIVTLSKSNMKYMVVTEKKKEEFKNYHGLTVLFNSSILTDKNHKYTKKLKVFELQQIDIGVVDEDNIVCHFL